MNQTSWIGSISNNQSNIIKGVLILLIVLGHNAFLTKNIDGLFGYLYSFHVFGFFILPWFYNSKPANKKSLTRRFVKLFSYYTLFFLLQYFIFNFLFTNNGVEIKQFIVSFIHGGHFMLEKAVGFQYLWFLPTFFFAMLYKDLYYLLPQKIRPIFPVIGACVIIGIWCFGVSYQSLPAILQGLFFTSYGLLAITPPHTQKSRHLRHCNTLIYSDSHPF